MGMGMEEIHSCEGVTRKGRRCGLVADPVTGFCSVHDPALRCGEPLGNGKRCRVPSGGVPCAYHQRRAGGSKTQVFKRQHGLREGARYCRACATEKPFTEFWDSKKRRYVATCAGCLSSRRVKARLRAGKRVHYVAYLRSTAWAEKRAAYWRSGRYDCCYLCDRPRFPGMELHHRTYERLGRESLDDLVPVCPEHHDLIARAWARVKDLGVASLWEVTEGIAEAFRRQHGLGDRAPVDLRL